MPACFRIRHSSSSPRSLVRLYTRFGYLPFGGVLRHPEIGEVHPMRLELNNERHLRAVGAVFLRCWNEPA